MRNGYLKYFLALLFVANSYAQGADVIFWVDNSGSVSPAEYTQMNGSIQALMAQVLLCNPANKITVVQYGATSATGTASKIWIESGFTNTNFTFSRATAVGGSDFAHESLGLIGNALDGVINTAVLSPVKTLTRTPGNALVIYLFTDGYRSSGSSYLVNSSSVANSTVGTNTAFQNYTTFKTIRNATFILTIVSPDTGSTAAAAAIASGGGSYLGAVESYPADPAGSGTTPRFLLNKTNFVLTSSEITNVTEDICSVVPPTCPTDLVLISPNHDILTGQNNREASNSITASNRISSSAVGLYHAGNAIVLKSGFHSTNGSRFRGYILDCNGIFVGRQDTADLDTENGLSKEQLGLYPNPASNIVTISMDEAIKNITVTSIDGLVIFNKKVNTENYELNVSGFKNGLYIVTVETIEGKIVNSKLIKN